MDEEKQADEGKEKSSPEQQRTTSAGSGEGEDAFESADEDNPKETQKEIADESISTAKQEEVTEESQSKETPKEICDTSESKGEKEVSEEKIVSQETPEEDSHDSESKETTTEFSEPKEIEGEISRDDGQHAEQKEVSDDGGENDKIKEEINDDACPKTPQEEASDNTEHLEQSSINGTHDANSEKLPENKDDASSTSSAEDDDVRVSRRRSGEEDDDEVQPEAASDREGGERKREQSEEEAGDSGGEEQESEGESDGEAPKVPPTALTKEEKEDRKNPAFVPRRGNFFQHDTREDEVEAETTTERQSKKKGMMEKPGRWQHDMFDESEQTPKSRHELINSYGYDIRNESRAPRDPHGRRYGRSQNVERDWRYPESYGRRSFGGYRRSFGAGGGRGRGGGRRRGQPRPQGSRSVSACRRRPMDSQCEQVEERMPSYEPREVELERSRSFSEGERKFEKSTPYYSNRGRYSGPSRNQRGTFGTVEFRRRGRGMAFAANYKGTHSGRGRSMDMDDGQEMSRRSADNYSERLAYNDNARDNRQYAARYSQQRQQYKTPPRFQHQQTSHTMGRPTYSAPNSSTRPLDDEDIIECTDASFDSSGVSSQERYHQQINNRQRPRNQGQSNPGAPTKRYSAIRQQVHPQSTGAAPVPISTPLSNMANSVQQGAAPSGAPLIIQKGPPPISHSSAPLAVMASPAIDHPSPYAAVPYPGYFNGSAIYQQSAPVSIPEVYSIPPAYADGNNTYVLQPHAHGPMPPPTRFIGQQQYSPAVYHSISQPVPPYSVEPPDAYVATGGRPSSTGGTVYFDAGSQHLRTQHTATDGNKRRDKSIPIVAPAEPAAANENVSTDDGDKQ